MLQVCSWSLFPYTIILCFFGWISVLQAPLFSIVQGEGKLQSSNQNCFTEKKWSSVTWSETWGKNKTINSNRSRTWTGLTAIVKMCTISVINFLLVLISPGTLRHVIWVWHCPFSTVRHEEVPVWLAHLFLEPSLFCLFCFFSFCPPDGAFKCFVERTQRSCNELN